MADTALPLLLVEDSDSDAALFQALLEKAAPDQFHVVRVATVADGLKACRPVAPACAVVDLGLPDADGLEAVRRLAAAMEGTALVVLTGRQEEEMGLRAIQAGAEDYLSKGQMTGALLVRSIRYAVERKQAELAMHEQRIRLAEAQRVAGLGSWHWAVEADQATWSDHLFTIFGLSADWRPSFDGFLARVHPSDRAGTESVLRGALERMEPFDHTFRIVRTDGAERWLHSRGEVVASGGRPVAMHGISLDVTDRLRAEADLRLSRERLDQAQRMARLGSWEVDLVSGHMSWSDEQYHLLGYRPGSVTPTLELLASHLEESGRTRLAGLLSSPQSATFDARVQTCDGRRLDVSVRVQTETDELGGARVHGVIQDVTDQRRTEAEKARLSRERELVLEASAEGIYGIDCDGRITFANPAAGQLLGYEPADLVGRDGHSLLHSRHADGSAYPRSVCPIHRSTRALEQVRVDSEVFWHRDGSAVEVEYWSQPTVENGRIVGAVVNFMDIGDRKRHENELTHQALHDSLTGLPNRSLLKDRLEQALTRAVRLGGTVGVLFVDLDRFKEVNDGLGHTAGDQVLRQVADRLREAVRREDTIARFGGDEFVILCDDIGSAWEATLFGERVLACFEEPLVAEASEFYMTASVGVAMAGRGQSAEEILRNADSAMYRAKERGRARVELFDEKFRARTAARLELQADLRRAMERDELRLVYQPIVALADRKILGVEALLRWHHPTRGVVNPEEFIPIAEETGLIVAIGDWVLRESIAQVSRWRATIPGASGLYVSVNVSARQLLVPNIVDVMSRSIGETGIGDGAIHLEITESALMRDVELSIETLRGLKMVGALLSVDDFGTGYSSLSYLKRLPLDTIKVDRSFVSGLGSDPHDSSIVSAVVAMGGALGLATLAEGVETSEQMAELRALGCDLAQGFYFAEPLAAEELARLLGRAAQRPLLRRS